MAKLQGQATTKPGVPRWRRPSIPRCLRRPQLARPYGPRPYFSKVLRFNALISIRSRMFVPVAGASKHHLTIALLVTLSLRDFQAKECERQHTQKGGRARREKIIEKQNKTPGKQIETGDPRTASKLMQARAATKRKKNCEGDRTFSFVFLFFLQMRHETPAFQTNATHNENHGLPRSASLYDTTTTLARTFPLLT